MALTTLGSAGSDKNIWLTVEVPISLSQPGRLGVEVQDYAVYMLGPEGWSTLAGAPWRTLLCEPQF